MEIKSSLLKLLNSVYGVLNIILTGIFAFTLTSYPTSGGLEEMVLYDHMLLAVLGVLLLTVLWYSYLNLYNNGIMHKKIDDIQEVLLWHVNPQNEVEETPAAPAAPPAPK